jgi:hypothetical protein
MSKRAKPPSTRNETIALALTWDGARWPIRTLPPKARAFLASSVAAPSAQEVAQLFQDGQVTELRICWVPRLKGGDNVLSEPFPAPAGVRIAFKPSKIIPFGDVLGVIYKR